MTARQPIERKKRRRDFVSSWQLAHHCAYLHRARGVVARRRMQAWYDSLVAAELE